MATALLSNANLDENVLTNARLQLIGLTEEIPKQEDDNKIEVVKKEKYGDLLKHPGAFEQIKVMNASREGTTTLVKGSRDIIFGLISELSKKLKDIDILSPSKPGSRSGAHLFTSLVNSCKIYFDDAVTVLRKITHISPTCRANLIRINKAMTAIRAQLKTFMRLQACTEPMSGNKNKWEPRVKSRRDTHSMKRPILNSIKLFSQPNNRGGKKELMTIRMCIWTVG